MICGLWKFHTYQRTSEVVFLFFFICLKWKLIQWVFEAIVLVLIIMSEVISACRFLKWKVLICGFSLYSIFTLTVCWISGTFSRRQGQILMDLVFANRAMQAMSGFAIQFNKNSFGLTPATPLQVNSPLPPNQQANVSLQLNTCTWNSLLHITKSYLLI